MNGEAANTSQPTKGASFVWAMVVVWWFGTNCSASVSFYLSLIFIRPTLLDTFANPFNEEFL